MNRCILVAGLLLLAGCAATPEQRLATTCNGLATDYRTATTLKAEGKLPADVNQRMVIAAKTVQQLCDATQPPLNMDMANAQASALLVQFTTDLAKVK
jgi:hypothetical protein